jgi:hypothetical protein
MFAKSPIPLLVSILLVLLASSTRAQEETFSYEAVVTTAQPGAPAAVGDVIRITFTFSRSASPILHFPGRLVYPFVEATGRAGSKSWTFDIGFIGVQNDYHESPTGPFNDQFTVILGQASATPVEFILDLSSWTSHLRDPHLPED